jgi:hypothetical protein
LTLKQTIAYLHSFWRTHKPARGFQAGFHVEEDKKGNKEVDNKVQGKDDGAVSEGTENYAGLKAALSHTCFNGKGSEALNATNEHNPEDDFTKSSNKSAKDEISPRESKEVDGEENQGAIDEWTRKAVSGETEDVSHGEHCMEDNENPKAIEFSTGGFNRSEPRNFLSVSVERLSEFLINTEFNENQRTLSLYIYEVDHESFG